MANAEAEAAAGTLDERKQNLGTSMSAPRGGVIIEGAEGNPDGNPIPLDVTNMMGDVQIRNCKDTVFMVSAKCKAVIIDNCTGCTVQVDQVMAAVEIVNSKKITLYIQGSAPTVTLDKSADGKIVLLPSVQSPPNVVSSMTADTNITIVTEEDEVELPIPYQFQTTIDLASKSATTTAVQHG